MHPAQRSIEELEKECRWTFSRASGPGGQNRNKVETGATVEHSPSGITASATELRNQSENRAVAMHRLRCALAVQYRNPFERPKADIAQIPSPDWLEYTKGGRVQISERNALFPSLLAEAMLRLADNDWNVGATAIALQTSATQLIKLLAQYPPALQELNTQLVARGLSPRSVKH
jgi:hypothetical protein